MPDRAALEPHWLDLTRRILPGLARDRGFPVSADHCFQRILLDHACDGVWYDTIAGRPAYAHADEVTLQRAVDTAEAVLAGRADLHELNRRSLAMRRARKG